jgi:anthranilate synthase/aminodeoxychorismate synthase-like glutamine amidotransferase
MKALLIDHDDSFTENLRHWLKPVFEKVDVINHENLKFSQDTKYDLYVLSPGPKRPEDYPHSLAWLASLDTKTPVYGVCLGLQMMAVAEVCQVETYTPPLHGKRSKLKVINSKYIAFDQLEVARYHSLIAHLENQSSFEVLAESKDDQKAMWIKHKSKNWMAVQFHPESFLTEQSDLHLATLKTWLKKC